MRGLQWSPLVFAVSLAGCGGWASGLGGNGDDFLGHDATADDASDEDTFATARPDTGADTNEADALAQDATSDADAADAADTADALVDVLADAPPYDGPPKALGTACGAQTECATKHCVDGVCCETACATACLACNGVGTAGYCRWIASGAPDPGSCDGAHSCNGVGGCIGALGQPCTSPAQCASPYCVDGVCCDSGCGGVCQACDVAGHLGACSPIPAGEPDDFPAASCAGANACSGSGTCLHPNGTACISASQCLSGSCADGVCCDTACDSPCYACSLAGVFGTCKPIGAGQIDTAPVCAGLSVCDGKGSCLAAAGQPCTSPADCASGKCTMMRCG